MLLGLGLLSKTGNGVNSVKRITYIVTIDFSMFEVQIFKCNSHTGMTLNNLPVMNYKQPSCRESTETKDLWLKP